MDFANKRSVIRASLLLAAVFASSAGAERLGDFDGDGKADVLLRHTDGSWRYHVTDGASVANGAPVRMTPKPEWYWAGAGDFNGDGRDDVMLRRADGPWVYYPLDGSRVIVEERGWANMTRKLDWRAVGVGDFNADGRDDMLLRRADGAWVYYPMNGRRVIVEERGWANMTRDVDWRMAGTGDFDGDGRLDVLLRHVVDGAWRVYSMNGRRVVAAQSTTLLPDDLNWRLAGIGDFDGDGRDEVLLRHADGRWQYRVIDGTAATPVTATAVDLDRDWAWRLAGIGDGDGDGRDDVLLRHDDGEWRWHRVDGYRVARGSELDLPRDIGWAMPARPVYIPDAALRTAVEDALGKARGEFVRPREFAELRDLVAEGAGITDLSGIGSAVGLSRLDLRFNKIRSVSPLVGIVGLRVLDLNSNRIRDVSTLAHLPALKHLVLTSNAIVDVSALSTLTGVRALLLDLNDIHDAAPLAGLIELSFLSLSFNDISDVSPLARLTALDRLDLFENRIEDISPLAGLTSLTALSLSRNRVENISPLSRLTRLTFLSLGNNRVEDWSPLSGLARLTSLDLHRSRLDDLSVLAGLTALTQLRLADNNIEDISPLSGLTRLEELDLGRNRVANIDVLVDMTRLEELQLGSNRISDLSPLAGLTALTRISLNDNDIEDISPLGGLTALARLMLQDNRVEDISPLAGLTRLEELNLDRNRVVDIAVVENLTSLDVLHLAYNKIADLKPLVNNAGLAAGDLVDVRGNPLSEESSATAVPELVARGVRVEVKSARLELVHDDRVVVLQVDENIGTQTWGSGLALFEYAQALYGHFDDVFDFVMFFSNLDDIDDHENARYYGVYSAVRNDTAGVGMGTFYDNRYGSADKLKGVIHFPYNRALLFGPSLHELLHAWANDAVPTAVHGHWGFSSADGQLGGFDMRDLVELGDNRYAAGRFGTFANGGNGPPYSPIELYFAGYLPPEEVPDLWVAADGRWVVENGSLVRTEDGHGIFTATDVRTYSIEDIVAEHGARIPSMGDAQWHFRVAVVLLTDADHPATTGQLDLLSQHAASFSLQGSDGRDWLHNYHEATGGRGSVAMGGLSDFRKAGAAPVGDLPASFGVVPEPYLSMIDGRCLPISAVPIAGGWRGAAVGRGAGTLGQAFFVSEK